MSDVDPAALERLTAEAMASGMAWLADNIDMVRRHSRDKLLIELLGDFPREFLSIRSDLVTDLTP